MKKLTLNVDELEVTGFATAPAESQATVNGADAFGISRPSFCMVETCLC